jgi:hypothetical protein
MLVAPFTADQPRLIWLGEAAAADTFVGVAGSVVDPTAETVTSSNDAVAPPDPPFSPGAPEDRSDHPV